MSVAPDWVWRLGAFLCVVVGVFIVALSNPFFDRLHSPRDYPISSTVIISVATAVIFGSVWWLYWMGFNGPSTANPSAAPPVDETPEMRPDIVRTKPMFSDTQTLRNVLPASPFSQVLSLDNTGSLALAVPGKEFVILAIAKSPSYNTGIPEVTEEGIQEGKIIEGGEGRLVSEGSLEFSMSGTAVHDVAFDDRLFRVRLVGINHGGKNGTEYVFSISERPMTQ